MIRGIVLVVIDCLRADHLSGYGYHRETTPTIDALARHGWCWTEAYSPSSWTKPAVASMLTGLYPSQHRVLKGPKRIAGRPAATTDTLAAEYPHVAEALSRHGWRCAAFLNNAQLEPYAGFARGFHTYTPHCRKADRQLEAMSAWLERHGDQPFLIYVHMMEAHWPYKPRRRHVAMFGGDRDASRFARLSGLEFTKLARAFRAGRTALSAEDLEDLVRLYDASVRRLDGKIKILRQVLEDRGVADQTALVITGDHGEEFGEHGSIGHGHSLHVEVTRVPLVIWRPDQAGQRRWTEPVSLVDLPRTLLALAGADEDFPGCDLIGQPHKASPAYSELSTAKTFRRALRSGRWRLHRRAASARQDETALEDLLNRLHDRTIESTEEVQLFDVTADPYEQVNVADRDGHEGVIAELTDAMHELGASRDDYGRPAASEAQVEVDDAVLDRLRALGYVE